MVIGSVPFMTWLIFNNVYDVLPLELSIYSHLFTWTPVFATFIINQFFFDDAFFRALFRYSVVISVAGVFVGQWVGLAFHLIGMSKLGAWGRWFTWVIFLVNLLYTLGGMVYQVFVLPKVFQWIDNAPYGDQGAYDSEVEQTVEVIVEVIEEANQADEAVEVSADEEATKITPEKEPSTTDEQASSDSAASGETNDSKVLISNFAM